MIGSIRRQLSYANVMSTLAVFLALGGGLAWALANNTVKSRHIVNDQVKPADVRDDTLPGGGLGSADVASEALTGGDIDESTLGQVPTADSAGDAAALGGIGPGGFVQGSAAFYSGRENVPNNGNTVNVLDIPEIGQLNAACNGSNDLILSFFNDSGSTISLTLDDGAADPSVSTFPNNTGSASLPVSGAERLLMQAGRDSGASHDLATIIMTGQEGANPCVAQAQAIVHTN
jgi:hypothetical protein